jgi:cytochrome P450
MASSTLEFGWLASFAWQARIRRAPLDGLSQVVGEAMAAQFYRGLRRVTLLNDPLLVRQVLHRPDLFGKTRKRRVTFGQGLVTAEGKAWREQREMSREVLLPATPEAFMRALEPQVGRWLNRAASGEPFCLFEEINRLNLDLVCRTMLDIIPNPLELDGVSRAIDVLIRRKPRSLDATFRFSQHARDYFRALRHYRNILRAWLARGISSNGLIARLDRETRARAISVPLEAQVSTYLLAASDTSASALSATLYLLAQNDERQTAAAQSERYTQNSIKEAMRLYPPVWLMSRRARGASQLGNVAVRRGDEIVWLPQLLHRRPTVWPSPHEFRPERFESLTADQRACYLPFGAGPRACPGAPIASEQASRIIRRLLASVRLRPCIEWRSDFLFTQRPQTPLWIRAVPCS